jgi:predicted enzyme related to lactoylglutathione lyase
MNTSNPVVYFEIPVNDIERAEKFYTAVFNFSFEKEMIDHYEMALFPFEEKIAGSQVRW